VARSAAATLLELAWEAMESAGTAPSSLARSNCAVYVGIPPSTMACASWTIFPAVTAHSITGNT